MLFLIYDQGLPKKEYCFFEEYLKVLNKGNNMKAW